MITCEACILFSEGEDVGTHWICDDCQLKFLAAKQSDDKE
jgi:hypothetical protein